MKRDSVFNFLGLGLGGSAPQPMVGFQGLGLDLGLSLGSSDPEAGALPVTLATFNQIGCVLAVTTDTPYKGNGGRGVKTAQQRSVRLFLAF